MNNIAILGLTLATTAALPTSLAGVPAGFVDNVLFTATTPTGLAYEPGSGNAFVIEQGSSGSARVRRRAASGGVVTTALTLTGVDASGERGLLGIAFDPDYLQSAVTRWVYLYYTRNESCAGTDEGECNLVVRYLESGGMLGAPDELLEIPTTATNHNGGTLRFAPDKTLFISVGDDDTDAEPNPLSRDLSDLRGKILRINRDGSVPVDNPFVGQAGRRHEIWAWGLRNPFRFSIDPETGIPWIGDVGEQRWEEIDRGVKGADYGYPCLEGNAPFQLCSAPGALPPVFAYGHNGTPFTGATIIGGPVYRGAGFPASYQGRLFFADFISGWIRSAAIGSGGNSLSDFQLFTDTAGSPVDLVESPNGCLGYIEYSGGVHEICGASDVDGDGFNSPEDCNDLDVSMYPGAPELCDGKNNDCAGGTDDATCDAFSGGDETVDGFDLSLLGRFFGLCSKTPESEIWADAELTNDGCLDGVDLAVLTAAWGCSGSVPICR